MNQQAQINLDNTEAIVCDKCGCGYFTDVQMMRRLPALASPTGRDEIVPIPTALCLQCGRDIADIMNAPEEEESKIIV